MGIKGFLIDLDHTLYSYEKPHAAGLSAALHFLSTHSAISCLQWKRAYDKARSNVHRCLEGTASSHNRLLYFQEACEFLKVKPFHLAYDAYKLYWKIYIQRIRPFPGLDSFLKSVQSKELCLITDQTADIQFQKVKKLKLERYIQLMVTSEEAGIEKPDPKVFRIALKKLNLKTHEVVMIGDDFKKDILGASRLGMQSVWFNANKSREKYSKRLNIIECVNMTELTQVIEKL